MTSDYLILFCFRDKILFPGMKLLLKCQRLFWRLDIPYCLISILKCMKFMLMAALLSDPFCMSKCKIYAFTLQRDSFNLINSIIFIVQNICYFNMYVGLIKHLCKSLVINTLISIP